MRLIFSAGGLRDQRGCSHAQHLGECQHNHRDVARHTNRSDRFLPEASDPVEIGQQIKCLHHHAHGQKSRHVQQVPGHRDLSKILHWRESSRVAVRLRRMSVANCRGRLVARNFFSIKIIPTRISVAGEVEEELRQQTVSASLRDEESRRSTK